MNPNTNAPTPTPAPPQAPPTVDRIDQTIQLVEGIYQQLTGRPPPPPNGNHAPMPPEVEIVSHVERQVERLVAELGGQVRDVTARWTPPLLVWEDEGALVITCDVPGMARDTIEVSVGAGVLTITGERSAPWRRTARVMSAEHPLGRFRRVVQLPLHAQTEQLAATLRDGVLEVRVPLSNAELEHHNVPIRS
jgi:HSP20 family protein